MNIINQYARILPIKKRKGGININKKIFFLITLFSILLLKIVNVNAETATFYEGEYINDIYMSKYQYSTNTIYYQKARFFRKSGTNEFAYCIEPFNFFNDKSTYQSVVNPYNLSSNQKKRIERIAHFGYGYKNHTDVKWYAITQMMIWEAADPSSGSYFFTDYLNGNKIFPYQNEIAEINSLVDSYDSLPLMNEKTYDIIEDQTILIDGGNILNYYNTNDKRIKKQGNSILVSNLKEGVYEFTLYRNDNNYNQPVIFYQSNNSQNLVNTGNLEEKVIKFYVNVYKTGININKLDEDTKSTTPSGEAELNGAIINVLDIKKHIVRKIDIENNKGYTENLPFGTYYLQEVKSGTGYSINNELYEINISVENPQPTIDFYNKVIEKKIKIIKKYGEEENFLPEKNIDFEIYDKNNNIVKTVSTDENGEVIFNLPYGKYRILQKNSTSGYSSIEPFQIIVDKTDEEEIELKDYKIPVPNTFHNKINIILLLIMFLCII